MSAGANEDGGGINDDDDGAGGSPGLSAVSNKQTHVKQHNKKPSLSREAYLHILVDGRVVNKEVKENAPPRMVYAAVDVGGGA